MNYHSKALEVALNDYQPNPKRLTYKFFNRGSQGTSSEKRSCDEWFLNALTMDLLKYSVRLAAQLTDSDYLLKNSELTADAVMTAKNLFCVMKECRRLRYAPELFPSDLSREVFFYKLSSISKSLLKFKVSLNEIKNPAEHVRVYSKWDAWKWIDRHRNQSSSYFPDEMVGRVPYWHSYNIGTNIWNKWLNNRRCYQIPPIKQKIIQRVPPNGMKIVNRWWFMYNIVEASYEQANRVIREVSKSRRELSAATGEIHELPRTLTASSFEELRGLKKEKNVRQGLAMREEVDGTISLEMICDAIYKMFKPEEEPEQLDRAIIAVYLRN